MQDKTIRLRLLAVFKIITETTSQNPICVQGIIQKINRRYNLFIPVSDRRAIVRDLEAIKESGVPVEVIRRKSNKHFYFMDGGK
jgi:hypothetical protein